VTLTPTPVTAALAGAFAGVVMPILWQRLLADGTSLVIAFLLVVALPAHAFVVGLARHQSAEAGSLDTALLKRVGIWLLAAVAAAGISHALRA
jgi:hypothetical protein